MVSHRERILFSLAVFYSTKTNLSLLGSTESSGRDGAGVPPVALDEQYVGMIIGVVTAVLLLLIIIMVCLCLRRRQLKYNNNHRAMKSIQPPRCNLITMNLNDLQNQHQLGNTSNGKLISKSNGMLYNCVAQSDTTPGEKDEGGSLLYKLDNLTAAQQQSEYGYGIQTRKLPEPPARTPGSTGSY